MSEAERPLIPSKAQLHVRWGQLYGSATSLWLAQAARKASGPLLVIAPDARQASRMEDELRFFCEPGTYIEHFPAWETLPYDLFSPHPDIVSQRLRMLSTLPRLAQGIVVVDLETALQRLPPPTYIHAHAFELRVGDGRIRGARLDHRPFSDGQPDAVPHRPVRRRGRKHPRVRSGNPALRRARAGTAVAAGPRVSADRGRHP